MVEAGTEVHIPPEFIQQAIREIQARQKRARKASQLLFKFSAGMLAAVALWSGWTYNSLSNTESIADDPVSFFNIFNSKTTEIRITSRTVINSKSIVTLTGCN